MNITTQRLSLGYHSIVRDGREVARVNRVDDASPLWELIVLDGTDIRLSGGRHPGDFVTLKDAVRHYTYCARKVSESPRQP